MNDLYASEAVKASEPAPPLPESDDADDNLTIAYCVTIEQVEVELQDVLADAAGRPLGLDVEMRSPRSKPSRSSSKPGSNTSVPPGSTRTAPASGRSSFTAAAGA
jgi:hypothetical protein